MPNVKSTPDGYRTVTPYLFIRGAVRAIDFYKDVFGAKERVRMPGPDGRLGHAELEIGDSVVMLADENPKMHANSPDTLGGCTSSLHIYVENVDAVVDKAIKSGAKLLRPVTDQFYGDRQGYIADPFGQLWSIATHVEDVSPEEMKKRMAKMASQAAGA